MPVAFILALGSAGMWGASDFMGGLATRRVPALASAFLSQLVGLILTAIALPWIPGEPVAEDLIWGALAGVGGGLGIFFLYRGLAEGRMNVIAPVTAVTAALTPVVVGLALGEVPGAIALGGIAVAIVAVVLLGLRETPGEDGETGRLLTKRALMTATAAGLGVGAFYVFLGQTSEASGIWPLLSDRIVACAMFGLIPATWRGVGGLRRDARAAKLTVGAGTLDFAANASYLIAAQQGPLTLVPVLASLYPASTVLLARIFLHERLGPRHLAGIALALIAIVMITLGS